MRKLNISNISKIVWLLILVCVPFNNRAQNTADTTKKKMIEIKLNDDFIFGEAISDDKEMAYGEAMDDLLAFANELKNSNSQEKISISDLITNVETLVYEEGSRFEVLVYIPFKIVIETDEKPSSAKNEIIKSEKDITKTPVQETPIVEISVEEKPVNEIPVQVTSVVETPFKESTIVEKPVQEISVSSEKNIPENSEIEEFLINQENFSEIKSFLSEMKKNGKIKETGAVEAIDTPPSDASLIVIDELGGLLSILSPVRGSERINYKTQKTDSEKNYNSKFIVWYRK